MKTPPLIYVAGPYRGPASGYIESNIASARHVGMLCARKGWYPVIPHNNTARFDLDFPNLQSDAFWLAGTLELMRKCDAVVLCPGWSDSSGTNAEIDEAEKIGIKVYNFVEAVPEIAPYRKEVDG